MTYLKDFVQSTLSSGVDNVETGFPLSDASDFPDPDRGHYWAYVWDAGSFPDPADDANAEEVLVTAKTGNTLTVVRGRGTQTAVAHSAGEKVAVMGSAANIGHSTYVTPAAYDVDTTGSTAQQTKLQQMIDDLDDTRGGTIYLPEGTYLISAQLAISSKTNVSLIGAGPNTVIKTATTGHTMLAISTSTKIRVENIRFEGAGTGTTGVAINLANVDDSEFRNLQFGGTGDQAIVDDTTCQRNLFYGLKSTNSDGGGFAWRGADSIYANCIVESNGSGADYNISGSVGCQFLNLTSRGAAGQGFRVSLDTAQVVDCQFSNLLVYGAGAEGILVLSGALTRCTFTGLRVHSPSGFGVSITSCVKFSIANLLAYDCERSGLYLASCEEVVLSGINIDLCGDQGSADNQRSGVFLSACKSVAWTAGHVDRSRAHGVRCESVEQSTLAGVIAANNSHTDAGGTSNTADGISIDASCVDVDVIGCRGGSDDATKHQRYGITVTIGSSEIGVIGGSFLDANNQTGGLNVADGTTKSGEAEFGPITVDGNLTINNGRVDQNDAASQNDFSGVVNIGQHILFGGGGPTLSKGSGSPEGNLTAVPGSLYINTNGGAGTTFWVKESGVGNNGWVGV